MRLSHVDVSICICTYKRRAGLEAMLSSLARLVVPDNCEVEVVVVDNDRACSAKDLVQELVANFPFPLRYAAEPQSGVGYARNRCLAESTGEWIAFVDDDEWVEPQWLQSYWEMARTGRYDGLFGPVPPEFEVTPPAWLLESGFFDRPRFLTGTRLSWQDCATWNVLFRRQLVDDWGGFSPAFSTTGGEDSDLFWRYLEHGARFVWCDEAVVHEIIPADRMTQHWVVHRAYLGGHIYARLHAYRTGWRGYLSTGLRGGLGVLYFGTKMLLARISMRRGLCIGYQSRAASNLGKFVAALTPAIDAYGKKENS